ncbi:thiol reductant ABC exporter subunit CydD [Lacticaseibacillus saniviri]
MLDKQLFRLSGIRQVMMMLAGLTLLQAFVVLGQGYFLAIAITNSWQRQPFSAIVSPLIAFIICYALRQLLNWSKETLADHFAANQSQALQQQLLERLYLLGPRAVAQSGTGKMVTLALDGIPETKNYLQLILIKALNLSIIPWVLVVFVLFLNLRAGIILILMFPIIILFMVILGLAAKTTAETQYAGFEQMSNHFIDSLRGLRTLQLVGKSRQYAKNVFAVSETYRTQTMAVLRIANLSSFALDFFTTLSIAVVAVFLGLDLLNGKILLLPAMATLILAPEYFTPLREFGSDYHATLDGKNAMNAVFEVLDQPVHQAQETLTLPEWQADSDLTLSDIDLAYNEQAGLSVDHIDLHGYQKVAIIGPSGAGKSTLLSLIGGFLAPQSGTIDVLGHTLPHLGQPAWQQQVSYIPQHPYIFAASVGDNIRFYQPNADDAAVQAAVNAAGLTSWLATLPDGLQTRIGEGGRGISGGQAQRIALARTLLDTQRRVWLFDEPTAHLDIETEAELKQTMVPLFDQHLVIFATHRLHWLNQMNWVIVVADGRVTMQGKPAELAQNPDYQQLMTKLRGDFDV